MPIHISAEDNAQESCVSAFRALASLLATEAFGTWFYRIVVHKSLKWKNAIEARTQRQSAKAESLSTRFREDAGMAQQSSGVSTKWPTLWDAMS